MELIPQRTVGSADGYYRNEDGTPYYDTTYWGYVFPNLATADPTGAGIFDGQSILLTSPQSISVDVFSGKAGQKASSQLVSIAAQGGFKIQNDYWTTKETGDYWGPNHKLLDTAYVVCKFIIAEGSTSIPDLDFVVRGKVVDCYNYDKSYSHYNKVTGESQAHFTVGDYVSLKKMDGTVLNSNVQIIDKWTFANADGTLNTRFRYSIDPALQYIGAIPSITQFQMVSAGGDTWTMITFNFTEAAGSISTEWITPITSVANSNGYTQFNFTGGAGYDQGGDAIEPSSAFSVVDANGLPVTNYYYGNAVMIGTVTTTSLVTKYSWTATQASAQATVGSYMVRRNVVTLPAGANTSNNYYNGYYITLKRVNTATGNVTTQRRRIINYAGASQLATIDGLWDPGFHPKVGDTVSLTPAFADSRVSINPAVQLLDYISSTTYGRGLDPFTDLNLLSWLTTAAACDEKSNVTIKSSDSITGLIPGTQYSYSSGPGMWQGEVVGTDGTYVEFTKVIGKLTNKWNSWKSYNTNDIVYSGSRVYVVDSAGIKTTEPTHTSGSVNGLTYVTGPLVLNRVGTNSSPATINLVFDQNPVQAFKNGVQVPGYSLYDADGIDYWRLLGWDEFDQRYVTRHQTNLVIDTSLPLFDNVNSFLQHFGGILRYSAGQYFLDIEKKEGAIDTTDIRNITADHIIGKIRINDEGTRSAFNSLTASYPDPANKFEARNISFFNSDYLKADRGVSKKGTLTVPGVTNYYNTRLLADKFLNKSRFGMTASFNMAPRGLLLLAGQVIQLQYPRYNWTNKKFRILNLTHLEDATVDIVAEEYDDSFYALSRISKLAAAGLASNLAVTTTIGAPTNLRASSVDAGDENKSVVEITWTNSPDANTDNVATELYSSYSTNLYLDVNTIASNTITVQQNPHGLKVGELITSTKTSGGLVAGTSYFIASTPAANTITLSDTKGGPIKALMNGTYSFQLMTANLVDTVPVPKTSYIDTFGGIDGRVIKYYWVRHKIVQEG